MVFGLRENIGIKKKERKKRERMTENYIVYMFLVIWVLYNLYVEKLRKNKGEKDLTFLGEGILVFEICEGNFFFSSFFSFLFPFFIY